VVVRQLRPTLIERERLGNLIAWGVLIGIVLGICIDTHRLHTQVAEAQVIPEPQPKEIQIRIVTTWTKERIEEEIRATFPEAPNTAVAIAKCESGLVQNVQSAHQLSYGREESFGLMQIHARDWDDDAQRLGYVNYKTDVRENLKMARYIYDQAGKRFTPWSCYTKHMI